MPSSIKQLKKDINNDIGDLIEEIIKEIKTTPDNYTAWFKIIFDRFYNHIKA